MKILKLLLLLLLLPQWLSAQLWAYAEAGLVATGYNDVRITGSGGTFFSFPDDLAGNPRFYYRLRAGYRIAPRHEVFILYAPLRMNYSGAFDRDIIFKDVTFGRGIEPYASKYVSNKCHSIGKWRNRIRNPVFGSLLE